MTLQQILSPMRKAVTDFEMIKDGDRIMVGVSGGKDSLTLLSALKAYQRFSPQKFELVGVTIDMGFSNPDEGGLDAVRQYCKSIGADYRVIPTDIAYIIFEARKEKNPCSLCSKMRRGALCEYAKQNGFNKLALAHHADDLVETYLLSSFYEGRLSTFLPVSLMDRTGITVIRPLVYLWEKDISSFSKGLPVLHNPCPANKHTKREYVKSLLKSIGKDIPNAKSRLFSAIISPDRYNLFDKAKGE